MLTLWLVAALVSPSPPLARAAAAVRVGDAEAAEAALGEVAPDEVAPGGDDALVAGLLRAQARLVRGDGAGALAILDGLPAEPAVEPVAGLLVLRAAGLLPAADPGRLARLGQAAGRLGARDLPDAVDLELKLRVAESQLAGAPESRRLAVEMLRSLAHDQRDPTVPPEALGLLLDALEGDARRAVARRLLLEYGETEAGRRAMAVLPPESLAHEDRRTRARRLFAARAYDLAEAELARLVADAVRGARSAVPAAFPTPPCPRWAPPSPSSSPSRFASPRRCARPPLPTSRPLPTPPRSSECSPPSATPSPKPSTPPPPATTASAP